ncbi:DAK2 domain-containing protein [Corynebacterium jeddahense]|uniref:DAK2 domain protein n=1 Tax=Corynebacterium jeddahense TaxID=1414719 RepID=A0ABY7UMJ1_9CORY|nr:DAK2 domain-containing protein [Corynebacterium jeddahense]WCZ38793.1 DAK2 domain protein [Corynebacterium jeddahense]
MAASPLLDGTRLLAWARRAADELDRRRVEINALNVFPVPDADTGSNMAHTMAAAVEEAEALGPGAGAEEVAEALAVGAVRGARGNSGVVLSQVMRGVAQSIAEDASEGVMVAEALGSAVGFVDRAIADPVEGTVVTVLRAAAAEAREVVEEADDPAALSLTDVAVPATDAARVALARTPSQLPALREAGVVDAGGAGLVVLLETLVGETAPAAPGLASEAAPKDVDTHGLGGDVALEVLFSFEGDLDALEGALAPLGDSLIVARLNETAGRVHIHSHEAGRVVEAAYAAGAVSELRLEALPPATAAPAPATAAPRRLIIAVTPPGSLTTLYAESGAVTVAPGPEVISDMLAAIKHSQSDEIIVLPNGLLSSDNLAAVEKATRAMEQTITLLPTVRLVSGIAALSVYDETQPLATAAFTMSEAAGEMRTAVAVRAEKGALTQGGAVGKGDVVVTARGETLLIADRPADAVERACRRLLEHGGEQVTILFDPAELSAAELEELASALRVEVMVYPADGLEACAEIGVE